MTKIRFVLIVERGVLEQFAILCVSSIRKFGGKLANAPISCYAPRKQFYPGNKTIDILENLNAEVVLENLNDELSFYSLANKPIVLKQAAKKRPLEGIIFLDSDTIVLGEPESLLNLTYDIAVAPVFEKGIGIYGVEDPGYKYWESLAQLAQLDILQFPKIETRISKEEILVYWNTGVIGLNASNHEKIIDTWFKLINSAIQKRIFPKLGIYFLEQSAFAISVLSHKASTLTIPEEYNFAISKGDSQYNDHASASEQIKIIHHLGETVPLKYYLNTTNIIDPPKANWVLHQLAELKIDHLTTRTRNQLLLSRKNWLERLKYQSLKLMKKI